MKQFRHPPVLSIAGSDSSGGAGIQADLKTMTSLGCYGMTVITALTAQNTIAVQEVLPIPAGFVISQLKSVFDDIPPRYIKIGMLHDSELIEGIYTFLKDKKVTIVLDPVMVATSGDPLLKPDALEALQELLFPLAALVTPNIHEMALISSRPISCRDDLEDSGLQMAEKWKVPFLVKGGDFPDSSFSSDVLVQPDQVAHWYEALRVETQNTHGTGCTLSSAIASHLALGFSLTEAVSRSKEYIRSALEYGKFQNWGSGHGPVNHMWVLNNMYKGVKK